MRRPALSALAGALVLLGAGAAFAAATTGASIGRPPPSAAERLHPDRQPALVARAVGRMILVGFAGEAPEEDGPRRIAAMLAGGRLGGVVLFSDNVRSPGQVRRLTAALAAAGGGLPPLIAIDQEGGQIQRLPRRKGFAGLPSARAISSRDLRTACTLYTRTATELAGLGINTNLGPVVDLDLNPRSPAIGRKGRSYARNPSTVVAFARAFIDAHRRLGVLTSAKHFPGHGSAIGDSHDRPVDISATWEDDELEPYRALIAADPPALIMVGHLTHPRFSDGDRPASLSRRALTEALRRSLGFDGLIITDDLGMGAIARRYSVEEAAVMAIRAGADLVLVANRERPDPEVAANIIEAVVAAVAAGRIPASAITDADRRILAARRALVVGRAAWGPPSCGATTVRTGAARPDISSAAAETGALPP